MSAPTATSSAASTGTPTRDALYQDRVNPQWVRLLEVLQMNARYTRCEGTELFTEDGRRILDFLSGYCVHNLGHNHPAVIDAIQDELERRGPAMLQSHVPELAGELADKLCWRAGGRVKKVFFCSSGSEGVEAAIKFSRAHTRRNGLLYAEGAFHGLTCGALSLMSDSFWREHFGPMLPDTEAVPFGNLAALEHKLASKRFAAFIVEPVQGEGGVRVPPPMYLESVQALCRRHGTLFVVDEVQTGLYRTGRFLASHHYNIEPDMIVLAKALSGGLVPSGALLMSDPVYESVYGSIARAMVHTSTYSENGLAMRAGLASIEALEREHLGERALAAGDFLRTRLREALSGYEMVKEVRGVGLLNGIEFQPPRKLALRLSFEAFGKIHPGMFGQVVVMRLYRQGFLTQMCGNNFLTLKVAPPLVVKEREADEFVHAVTDVVEMMHFPGTFWSEALGLAKRAVLKMIHRTFIFAFLTAAAAVAAPNLTEPTVNPVIDRGYRQMYDLYFDEAHKTFAQWEQEHPADPIGPVSNAAAYLFAEFDRLNILHSEFFVDSGMFHRRPKVTPDPTVRQAFDRELEKSGSLSEQILKGTPDNADALFAKILTLGLRADYEALIERRDFDALKVIKDSRATAEKLLAIEPKYYDAYLAIGVENYLFSLKPAPVRWILQAGGAQTDRDKGVDDLRMTADKGSYLSPYARLLLAVAALRNKDIPKARDLLGALAHEFPHNRLYAQELAQLH